MMSDGTLSAPSADVVHAMVDEAAIAAEMPVEVASSSVAEFLAERHARLAAVYAELAEDLAAVDQIAREAR